jgi:hypothetical protein
MGRPAPKTLGGGSAAKPGKKRASVAIPDDFRVPASDSEDEQGRDPFQKRKDMVRLNKDEDGEDDGDDADEVMGLSGDDSESEDLDGEDDDDEEALIEREIERGGRGAQRERMRFV